MEHAALRKKVRYLEKELDDRENKKLLKKLLR
jgi:hypothetical protein